MGAPASQRFWITGLALFLWAGCAPGEDTRPSIVVVLVDELRKDSADEYMTGVNAAARRGVVAESMRSAAPWTYPSVISLMSGLYPQQHGADGHATENRLSQLPAGVPLLQQRLREAGYRTAAFVTNPFLLEWSGFDADFEHFDGSFVGSQGNQRGDSRVWKPTMFADTVNESVRAYLDGHEYQTPEFIYIHYIDVHGPWHGAPFRRGYFEAIRFVDRKIMEIYDHAMQRYDGNLLFVVTSDHGRSLDDDLQVGSGREFRRLKHSVHDYNLKIPFAILPSRVVGPARLSGPTSNIDVVPTLLEWVGVESRVSRPGRSLLPEIRGAATPPDRTLYFRNTAFGAHNDAVLTGHHKVIRFFDLDSGDLVARRRFDLVADPRETRALDDADDAGLFAAAAGDHGLAFEAEFESVDSDIEPRLRALGYLGEGDSEGASLPD